MHRLFISSPLAIVSTAILLGCPESRASSEPFVVVSLERGTLRLEGGPGIGRHVFPVGVGRIGPQDPEGPVGTFLTGPDPLDSRFYLASRTEPAFHRGLPFLRIDLGRRSRAPADGHLDLAKVRVLESGQDGETCDNCEINNLCKPSCAGKNALSGTPRKPDPRPYGIHGPVTPTLIWGRVSAGCIRMREDDLRLLFAIARRHPSMPVTFRRSADVVDGGVAGPLPTGPGLRDCPEAALGVRRLTPLAAERGDVHDRFCGGVDHWYLLKVERGDLVSVRLRHGGDLRVELYGPRAISTVASGNLGFDHLVPPSGRTRSERYLRVTRPAGPAPGAAAPPDFLPYTLRVSVTARSAR